MAAPNKRLFPCRKCGLVLPADVVNTPEAAACPRCHNAIIARVFPAFLQGPREGRAGETIGIDEFSSCFFHANRKAIVPCAECGRFLCALCDLEVEGRHLCPPCLEEGRKKQTLAVFRMAHTRWDNIALLIAVIPLVIPLFGWYVTLLTAPCALFISIWKWRTTRQAVVPYSAGRFILAFLISLVTLGGWALVFFTVLGRRFG